MKKIQTFTAASKTFIWISAGSILTVSLMAFFSPQAVMDLVQVKLENNDAFSSIRGVFGGVGLTLFCTLVYLVMKDVQKGLSLLALLWGFYALSRLVTWISEGPLGSFGTTWLMIESVFFITALVLAIASSRREEF